MLVISPKQPLLFPVQPLSDKKQRYPGVLGSDTLKKVPIYLQLFYFLINVPFFREILSVSADSYRFPRILIGFRGFLSVSAKSYRFPRNLIGFRGFLSVSAGSYRFPRNLIGFRGILSVSAKSCRFPRILIYSLRYPASAGRKIMFGVLPQLYIYMQIPCRNEK